MSEGQSSELPVDEDGLDPIEALVCDAAAAERSRMVHEGGEYYAERIIRRAIEQGTLSLTRTVPSPEQSGELVGRLRACVNAAPSNGNVVLTWNTANRLLDALESAQAEIARLTAALELCRRRFESDWDRGDVSVSGLLKRIDATLKGNQP